MWRAKDEEEFVAFSGRWTSELEVAFFWFGEFLFRERILQNSNVSWLIMDVLSDDCSDKNEDYRGKLHLAQTGRGVSCGGGDRGLSDCCWCWWLSSRLIPVQETFFKRCWSFKILQCDVQEPSINAAVGQSIKVFDVREIIEKSALNLVDLVVVDLEVTQHRQNAERVGVQPLDSIRWQQQIAEIN